MRIVENSTIGDAWRSAFLLVVKYGSKVMDGDDELLELLDIYITIDDPDPNDPVVTNQNSDMREWMHDNFVTVKKIPDLGNSWR